MQQPTIKEIIDNKQLTPVFQPIIDLTTPAIAGYEGLIRGPGGSEFYHPKKLFAEARSHDLIAPFEYICIELACREFSRHKTRRKLFLNISPMSLIDLDAGRRIVTLIGDQFKLAKDQVVIELSEQYPLEDCALLSDSICYIRKSGYELAIDDLGAGYSNLRAWSEYRPEYVKIDRHFISGIDKDPIKHDFVGSIKKMSRSLGCKVIAEGIEAEAELKTLRALGISHGQGYLLGKPEPAPCKIIPEPLYAAVSAPQQKGSRRYQEVILDLVEYCRPLPVSDPLGRAADMIKKHSALNCIPIVDSGRPVGVITRQSLFEAFIGRYGWELHANKPVRNYMHSGALIVEKDNTLADVSRMFTAGGQADMNIDILVTENNRYIGVAKTVRLLEKITEQQIQSARYSNPLTLLPGNVRIYEWIDDLLGRRRDFKLAYFDLNHFKPYNDTYGYARGDEIIVLLADIIKRYINPDTDRVGHIGGDDFVAIFRSDDWRQRCEAMLAAFALEIRNFYSVADLARGGIESHDRRGQRRFYPLLSVAIGIVSPDWRGCQSHHHVAALAMDAKHEAKKKKGNAIFISRRRGSEARLMSEVDYYGA